MLGLAWAGRVPWPNSRRRGSGLALVLAASGFCSPSSPSISSAIQNAKTPDGPGLVVCPGHGKVDAIDKISESQFPGGPCHRISMFLVRHRYSRAKRPHQRPRRFSHAYAGKFISALEADSALYNENVLIGLDSAETPGEKIGVRLIAGVLARRIVPFVKRAMKSSGASASASFNSAPAAIFTCR
jgi:hypothetical protein